MRKGLNDLGFELILLFQLGELVLFGEILNDNQVVGLSDFIGQNSAVQEDLLSVDRAFKARKEFESVLLHINLIREGPIKEPFKHCSQGKGLALSGL